MTSLLPWVPMLHQLTVNCPQCGALARFEFMVARSIERKARPLLPRLLKRQLTTASR